MSRVSLSLSLSLFLLQLHTTKCLFNFQIRNTTRTIVKLCLIGRWENFMISMLVQYDRSEEIKQILNVPLV